MNSISPKESVEHNRNNSVTGKAAGGHGLVSCDKSDRNPSSNVSRPVELTIYADIVTLTTHSQAAHGQRRGGGMRRQIAKFSRKSRSNMLRQWGKVRRPERPLFCTLTYPDSVVAAHMGGDNQTMPSRAKRDIGALRKRIARRWPHAGGFWRIEFKARQSGALVGHVAPHFHVVLFGVLDDVADLRVWLREAWYEIAHDGDEHEGAAGTQIDTARSRRHATYYMAKYTAKLEDAALEQYLSEVPPGRYWGRFGSVDLSALGAVRITWDEFKRLRRLLSRWLKGRNRRYSRMLKKSPAFKGFVIFGLGDESESAHPGEPPPIMLFMRAVRMETAIERR